MKTITKKDLVDRIAERTGQRRTAVKQSVQEFLDLIIEELSEGNRLEFRDFGVFESKERAARTAQNPKTLERVRVPAKRTVKFKVGRRMRDAMEQELQTPAEVEMKVMPGKDAEPTAPAPGAGVNDQVQQVAHADA